MKFLKMENVTYDYRDEETKTGFCAIDGVSMEVEEGRFIAILGRNGSGKSSLAKHMNALLRPTQGIVWVDGFDTRDGKYLWDIRQTVGMVFQNPDSQIVATMVEEEVAFGPENIGLPTDEICKRVNKALTAVDMIRFRHHSPLELSGGQKQRTAIAGIIAMEPKCIVLDEPTAMLDPVGRKEVLGTLHLLNREKNTTIVLITHHMDEAVYADDVYVMDDGKVAMHGKPKEIFSQVEKLKSLGLEVPQVTELAYMLKEEGLSLPDGILTIEELVEAISRLQDLGIRVS